MAEKRYYWLKLNNDFFDSIRIRKLRKIAGGDTYTIIYLKLLLYAVDKDGVLEYQGVEGTLGEELALAISEQAEDIGLCLNYLRSVGLAEVRTNSVVLPEAVEKTGSEGASAKRMRDLRKRSEVGTKNRQSSLCYGEKEIEKELELDKELDKEKEVISNEITKKEKRFVKPTVSEIQQYITENNFIVNAQTFFDYYESNGWVVGKAKMKDWKATVRGWERREQEKFAKQQKEGDPMSFLPFR